MTMIDQPSKFELYTVFVETITAAEQRRQQINNVYYSILLAVAAVLGADINVNVLYVVLPLSLVSLIFFVKIRFFRHLATAKFEVISTLEEDWDTKPFAMELSELKKPSKTEFRGILTHLESGVPLIVFLGSLLYLLYSAYLILLVV